MGRGAWWVTVHRVAKTQTWLGTRCFLKISPFKPQSSPAESRLWKHHLFRGELWGSQSLQNWLRVTQPGRRRQHGDLNPHTIWPWVLNFWAPPSLSQVLGTLRALQGQWPHPRGSLEGHDVLRPWGFQGHLYETEKQCADSDTEIVYNLSPQCEPCRVMVKNRGSRSGF